MRARGGFIAALLLAIAACSQEPAKVVTPALWEVTGSGGQRAWLFGTIHALPQRVDWRSANVDAALEQSDRLLLEIENADDPAALNAVFARLAKSDGLPSPELRMAPPLRPQLSARLREQGLTVAQLASLETWALALTLARGEQAADDGDKGLERELLRAVPGKPVAALEGAAAQLGVFDALPENDQRDLLAAVVKEASAPENTRLADAWSRGDMAALEREARTGLLAGPELREALLTKRNAAWSQAIGSLVRGGARPFVAVGAAHMAGSDGLPALLEAQGFAVRRVQ